MIKVMDFCRVVSDKKLKGSGLVRGDIVVVAGVDNVPASRQDPYLLRTVVRVLRVVDGEIQYPKEGNENKIYLIDPRSVEIIDDYVGG